MKMAKRWLAALLLCPRIAAVARCIQKAVGEQGACYRIGGDKFVICLKGSSCFARRMTICTKPKKK